MRPTSESGSRRRGVTETEREFPGIRDFAVGAASSIRGVMDAAALNHPKPTASQLLLEHCFLLEPGVARPTAAARLEALLGPELARRLVAALIRQV